jgi:hypothetical protein
MHQECILILPIQLGIYILSSCIRSEYILKLHTRMSHLLSIGYCKVFPFFPSRLYSLQGIPILPTQILLAARYSHHSHTGPACSKVFPSFPLRSYLQQGIPIFPTLVLLAARYFQVLQQLVPKLPLCTVLSSFICESSPIFVNSFKTCKLFLVFEPGQVDAIETMRKIMKQDGSK